MSSPDPFPQFVPNRVAAALRRIEEQIWQDPIPVAVEATAATPEHLSWNEARRRRRRPVVPGSAWGRLYDQRWCRLTLPRRAGDARAPRYLEWRDQGEATLYLDGVPYYGFDVAH